jgi:hypothetical protein
MPTHEGLRPFSAVRLLADDLLPDTKEERT